MCCAVINGVNGGKELWVVGGLDQDTNQRYDSVNIFDFATETWRSGPTLPSPRSHHKCVVVDNNVVVIGGRSGPIVSSILVHGNGVWREKSQSLSQNRANFAAVLVDERSGANCT